MPMTTKPPTPQRIHRWLTAALLGPVLCAMSPAPGWAMRAGLEGPVQEEVAEALGVPPADRLASAGLEEPDPGGRKRKRLSQEALAARRQRLAARLAAPPPAGAPWTIAALAAAEGLPWQTVYDDLAALDLLERTTKRSGSGLEERDRAVAITRDYLATFL